MRIFFVMLLSFSLVGVVNCSTVPTPNGSDAADQDTYTAAPDSTASGEEKSTTPEKNVQPEPSPKDEVAPEPTKPEPQVQPEPKKEDTAQPEPEPTEPPGGPEQTAPESQPTSQKYWTKKPCTKPGFGLWSGTKLGSLLKDMTLLTCDNKTVKFSEFCGAKAMWLFFAHSWCPYCQRVSAYMESVAGKYEKKGVVVINVLVEAGGYTSRTAATQAHCKNWKKTNGFAKVVTLYDPKKTLTQFWEQNYTALNLFVNKHNKITGKLHTHDRSTVERYIDNALIK